jgi:hypothetical protein
MNRNSIAPVILSAAKDLNRATPSRFYALDVLTGASA